MTMGVYMLLKGGGKGEVVYVGQGNIDKRVRAHMEDKHKDFDTVKVIEVENEFLRLNLESILIRTLCPKDNQDFNRRDWLQYSALFWENYTVEEDLLVRAISGHWYIPMNETNKNKEYYTIKDGEYLDVCNSQPARSGVEALQRYHWREDMDSTAYTEVDTRPDDYIAFNNNTGVITVYGDNFRVESIGGGQVKINGHLINKDINQVDIYIRDWDKAYITEGGKWSAPPKKISYTEYVRQFGIDMLRERYIEQVMKFKEAIKSRDDLIRKLRDALSRAQRFNNNNMKGIDNND